MTYFKASKICFKSPDNLHKFMIVGKPEADKIREELGLGGALWRCDYCNGIVESM